MGILMNTDKYFQTNSFRQICKNAEELWLFLSENWAEFDRSQPP